MSHESRCESQILIPQTPSAFHRHARLREPLQDQINRELMYRSLQFQECSQLFVGAHDQPLSVACASPMQIYSALKIGFQLAIEPFAVQSYSVRVVRSLSVVPQ